MKRQRLLITLIMTALVASTAGSAAGAGRGGGLQEAVRATAPLHNIAKAQDAGYTVVVSDLSGATCIAPPVEGAMGIHYLNPGLVDAVVDEAAPRGARLRAATQRSGRAPRPVENCY